MKFETKSGRVKALAFHPTRTWILSGLYTGVIQLWDYRIHILLEKFKEHNGPVRGLCFHSQQPLFVSGGDDYKVKVWNYRQKRCLFTLMGHIDYIRTAVFHHKYPWILSASDDRTIRIWNWQSRACIEILTGHNHYVMCAMFHPSDNLIVSASLDQTIIVWDILEPKQKTHATNKDIDLFSSSPVAVKFVLEGHDRGINWVEFHPSLPLIVSASDDRCIKIWRMNESKAWEIGSFSGHYNNVCCAIFHPRQDLIISNGEDKSIRVWNIVTKTCIQTMRRESDRFWALAVHPSRNIFAAGHDSGMSVFKLQRERPAYAVCDNSLFYVKERVLRKLEFDTMKDSVVILLLSATAYSIELNANQSAVLVCVRGENVRFDLYEIPKTASLNEAEPMKSFGIAASWVGFNQFAVLDKFGSLFIKNLKNTVTKKIHVPSCTKMFPAGGFKTVILQNNTSLNLFDIQQKRILEEAQVSSCRYAIWSPNRLYVALLTKHDLFICNKKLQILCTVRESSRLKSGAWDEFLFIYTTANHIKYVITNGDRGIVRTLAVPVYITKVNNDQLVCLDQKCCPQVISVDLIEAKFKLAVIQHNHREVLQIIKSSKLLGETIIHYLHQKGHPELALHYVKDARARFSLALKCANLDVALAAAKALNKQIYWFELAQLGLLYGNFETVEICYQQTKSFRKLAFLYVVTGNLDKLHKLVKIAEISKNNLEVFQNALYLGDFQKIYEVEKACGLDTLADLTLSTYGLHVDGGGDREAPRLVSQPKLLHPPPPIQCCEVNWPLLNTNQSAFKANIDNSLNFNDQDALEDAWCSEKEDDENEGWDIEYASLTVVANDNALPLSHPNRYYINATFPAVHIANGSFEEAFRILHENLGFVNFIPYEDIFTKIFLGSRAVIERLSPSYVHFPYKEPILTGIDVSDSMEELNKCYQLTTSGKFAEALKNLKNVLLKIPLLRISNKKELAEARQALQVCREYIIGLKMETTRKNLPKDPTSIKKECELAAYFTHCRLLPVHEILTLKTALNVFFKAKNYKTAASFAKRLLELAPGGKMSQQTKKMLQMCNANPVDELPVLYDEFNPFTICAVTYQPIYMGKPRENCPFCDASYLLQFKGGLCTVCEVSEIGKKCPGLNLKFYRIE